MKGNVQIGQLLRDIRVSRGITQKQAADGLYGKAAYSRIESGNRQPDKLLLDVIFERMGMSVEVFGTNYSVAEYLAIEWRNSILDDLDKQKWEDVLEHLTDYEKWLRIDGTELACPEYHEQFSAYIRLAVQLENEAKKELEEEILAAVRLTHPDFSFDGIECYLYSEQELALLILMAEYRYQRGQKWESVQMYRAILDYMEIKVVDVMEQYRFYPEAVLSLAAKLAEMGQYDELTICEKGIETLKKARRMNGMEGLLRLRNLGWQQCDDKNKDPKEKRLYEETATLLRELQDKSGSAERRSFCPLMKAGSRGYVLGEQIFRMRKCFGMSQSELSEEICTPDSLSRIERGVLKPKASLYADILKKLGAESCRFYPSICSSDYQAFLKLTEFNSQLARMNYLEAEQSLKWLENNLDQENRINRQMIRKNRAIIDESLGRITAEDEIRMLWEAFYITVPEGVDISIWPLNQAEVNILNNIAIAMQMQGKLAEAIDLLMQEKKNFEFTMASEVKYRERQDSSKGEMLEHYRNDGMRQDYNAGSYLPIMQILIKFIGRAGKYEEAMGMLDDVFWLSYRMGRLYEVRGFLYEYAWELEQIMERDQADIITIGNSCIPIFYRSYLLAVISDQKAAAQHTDDRCRKKYGNAWSINFLV